MNLFRENENKFELDSSEGNLSSIIQPPARATLMRHLREIPIFGGETFVELKDFMDIAHTIYVTITNKTEGMEFYHQLTLQIRGEARTAIENLRETKWQTIRTKLREYFSYLINKDIINSKLESPRQEKNESLNCFADRARKLCSLVVAYIRISVRVRVRIRMEILIATLIMFCCYFLVCCRI